MGGLDVELQWFGGFVWREAVPVEFAGQDHEHAEQTKPNSSSEPINSA